MTKSGEFRGEAAGTPVSTDCKTTRNPARGSRLGIEPLEAAEILRLLKFARRMNPDKPRPLLKGRRVLLLFYEASTRTRSSFEIAAKSMGAHTVLIQSARPT